MNDKDAARIGELLGRMTAPFGVGSRVWQYDGNRRVYLPGRREPSNAGYWRAFEVIAETKRSWVIDGPWGTTRWKLAKRGPWPPTWVRTEAEMLDLVWAADFRTQIATAILHATVPELRACAAILGIAS